MKRFLNTLYVTTQKSVVSKDRTNVVVSAENKELGRAPLHLLGSIVCFGAISVTPQLMFAAAENGVTITFLSVYGKYLSRVEGPISGNVLLRRAQNRQTMNEPLPVVRAILLAKIVNQRSVVRRAIRDHGDNGGVLTSAEKRMTVSVRHATTANSVEELRGIEGDSAASYFGVFDILCRSDDLVFQGRTKRPPRDPVNALLSFLYVLLTSDCRSALETVGLDSQMGFLHRDRPGRASLALDLMEEFRAPMADRVCLTMINRKQLRKNDFDVCETGGVVMREKARKSVLEEWQKRKHTTITHPFLAERMPLGLIPYVQAQLLAQYLREDIDGYPAFIWQ